MSDIAADTFSSRVAGPPHASAAQPTIVATPRQPNIAREDSDAAPASAMPPRIGPSPDPAVYPAGHAREPEPRSSPPPPAPPASLATPAPHRRAPPRRPALATASVACSPYRLATPPPDPLAVTQPFTAYLDGMASVCMIRTARIAMAVTFVVRDNDMLVGATRGPSYFCYRAEPGRHRIAIASDDGEQRFDVTLELRGRYYLDLGLLYRLGFVVPQGRWIDEADATALVQRSEHQVLQGAPAREALLIGTDVAGALAP
ncbi:MAG: hypothetical protein IPO88_04800 [Nannocystis sp.]|uniref:hypothetical protein n=2 Tax=Nannocystis sp. TaxID=1962667 RepID=UPI0024242D6F|nr:hypothetical protein [Nannocystis sp.]MBK9752821.1 hypothetical protein [Nannocystis sp.]